MSGGGIRTRDAEYTDGFALGSRLRGNERSEDGVNSTTIMATAEQGLRCVASVAIRRAEREERTEGPRLIHRPREGGARQQSRAIGTQRRIASEIGCVQSA